jgi:hypothetical protein
VVAWLKTPSNDVHFPPTASSGGTERQGRSSWADRDRRRSLVGCHAEHCTIVAIGPRADLARWLTILRTVTHACRPHAPRLRGTPTWGGSSHRATAIGTIDAAGGEARVGRCQLNVDRGELRRLAWATERAHTAELLKLLLGRSPANLQGRPDRARRYAIHADAFGAKLLGQRHYVAGRGSLGLGV